MTVEELYKKRYQVKMFDKVNIPDEGVIKELLDKAFDLTASKQNLMPYKIHVLGPKHHEYKKVFYELSSSRPGGVQNSNIMAPYVLLFSFRLVENPNPSVQRKIKRGDEYACCDSKRYRNQKSQTGIEIGMYAKVLTALCMEKDLQVSYLLCYPDWNNGDKKWEKLDFLKDPLLFSMQIGYEYGVVYGKSKNEYKPEKNEVINWL